MNSSEKTNDRCEQIISFVDEFGYMAVHQLSELCHASDVTIRRDLEKLDRLKRLRRTHGGAASLHHLSPLTPAINQIETEVISSNGSWLDKVDAVIMTTHYPEQDTLFAKGSRINKPTVAEAMAIPNMVTCVAIDNYQAGMALGRWAGEYANTHWNGKVKVLNLTYHLSNTKQRSSGFIAGMREVTSSAKEVLSLNAYSRYDTAYQLTRDALSVDPEINLIFAINDVNAAGAISACKDMNIHPDQLIVVSFGLDGTVARDAVANGGYYKAGLAMFPELVGPACVEAAIAAFNNQALPCQFITPYAIITQENIGEYYERKALGWHIRWDRAVSLLPLPCKYNQPHVAEKLPKRIGLVIRFWEHEWYQNLYQVIRTYSQKYGIEVELVDIEQTLREEVEQCRREVAHCAASQVVSGDVILIDGGPISAYLAEELIAHKNITVISNSLAVFEKLKGQPQITLIAIGGALRHTSQVFVGPTAENSMRGFRVDKLFLMVTGISPSFGLSHTNISEVTIKQNMIRSAREVILLADHTCFDRESTIQVAPLTAAHKVITDDALPASSRLELTKNGLQIIVAGMR